jgi:hypothetical protein
LRELSSRAEDWVVKIGRRLPSNLESHAFWRFFPFDVPPGVLLDICSDRDHVKRLSRFTGWWYDALSTQPEATASHANVRRNHDAARAVRNIRFAGNARFLSLHDWCRGIRTKSEQGTADPRTSEWTALEIVRQIGILVSNNQEVSIAYLLNSSAGDSQQICLHPANFVVPREWLNSETLTWGEWIGLVRSEDSSPLVKMVRKEFRVVDARYTPIVGPENVLFRSVNQVRGLGLLLYGLLRRDFDLPCAWNGPGHADVLNMLPRLLLKEVTCSSWTLGVMQACLQSRAMENLFFLANPALAMHQDDDALHDPLVLRTSEEVCEAIEMCQAALEKNQLSTINHRARQLTPISIRQLSHPNWTKEFDVSTERGAFDD